MAFVPPDNLRRLVRQYYRQKGLPVPRNKTVSKNSFLFALYECDFGYEFVDEVNSMFCINRQWVITPPECRGKGNCKLLNYQKIQCQTFNLFDNLIDENVVGSTLRQKFLLYNFSLINKSHSTYQSIINCTFCKHTVIV